MSLLYKEMVSLRNIDRLLTHCRQMEFSIKFDLIRNYIVYQYPWVDILGINANFG